MSWIWAIGCHQHLRLGPSLDLETGVSLWGFRHIFEPPLGTVQHTQNPQAIVGNAIDRDVGCAVDDQLSRSVDASRPAKFGELHQFLGLHPNAVVHGDSGLWTVRFDVIEDRIAVGLGEGRPLQPHGLSHLAQRVGASLGKVRFHLFMRDAGTRIVQRFLHFRAEPRIVRGGVTG